MKKLAVVSAILLSTVGTPRAARALEPIADTGCRLSSEQVRAREAYLMKELQNAHEDVGYAERGLKLSLELLDSYNAAYVGSKVAAVTSAVAFTIATAGTGYEAIPSVMVLGTVGYLGADAITDILHVENPRILKIDEELLAIVEPSRVTTPEQEEFYADELFDPIRNLLSEPDCGGAKPCDPWHPYLERMTTLAKKYWESTRARLDREDAWWKPDAATQLRGRRLAEADIPYAKMMIALSKGRVQFYEALLRTLRSDAQACRTMRAQRCWK